MSIRMKRLAALAAPFLLAPAMLIGGATAASASIYEGCGSTPGFYCSVTEDMGSGYCNADIMQRDATGGGDAYGNFASVSAADVDSGYTCNFFFQRNVNNTGWYKIDGFSLPSTNDSVGESPNEWNGAGYQARACLQFNWGSSLGAIHCSPAVSIA